MLEPGQLAPRFTLPDQDGNPVSLDNLRGKTVVLYFYPKDDTPGCTKEACDFRDAGPAITEAGAVVLGISPDPPQSHRKFVNKYELPFSLLSDLDKEVCRSYDVWTEKSRFGRRYMGVERTTVLIDGDGRIARVFRKVRVPGHVEAVVTAIRGR